jgi:hypothetical protein
MINPAGSVGMDPLPKPARHQHTGTASAGASHSSRYIFLQTFTMASELVTIRNAKRKELKTKSQFRCVHRVDAMHFD